MCQHYRRTSYYWIASGKIMSVHRATQGSRRAVGAPIKILKALSSSCRLYTSLQVFGMGSANCEMKFQIEVIQCYWNAITTGRTVHIIWGLKSGSWRHTCIWYNWVIAVTTGCNCLIIGPLTLKSLEKNIYESRRQRFCFPIKSNIFGVPC